jgi:hypothetical protein
VKGRHDNRLGDVPNRLLLLFGASWRPLFPVHYLAAQGLLRDDGHSFWMRRE